MDKQPPEKSSTRTRQPEALRADSINNTQRYTSRRTRNNLGAIITPDGLPLDISDSLEPPMLPNVNPDAISYDQAHAGVTVHIPGSPHLRADDVIVFYWGLHRSVSILYQVGRESRVVRVLCITYHFLPHAQYGLVDLHYQVQRCGVTIGTSPALRVTVNHPPPTAPAPA